MKELLDKLSSYNLFNYLLPGVLFAIIATKTTQVTLVIEDIVLGVFIYYFYGMVISRVGSVVIEPILKKTKLAQFSSYEKFIAASKTDSNIEVLSEANNTYRTMISLFIVLLVFTGVDSLRTYLGHSIRAYGIAFLMILALLFLLSYRKQTLYIRKRVLYHTASADIGTDDPGKKKT